MQKPLGNFISKYGVPNVKDLEFSATVTTLQGTEDILYYRLSGKVIAGSLYLPPAALMAGKLVTVVATDVTTGNVTVLPFTGGTVAADTIQGDSGVVASFVLASAHGFVTLLSTGDRWIVVNFDLSV